MGREIENSGLAAYNGYQFFLQSPFLLEDIPSFVIISTLNQLLCLEKSIQTTNHGSFEETKLGNTYLKIQVIMSWCRVIVVKQISLCKLLS